MRLSFRPEARMGQALSRNDTRSSDTLRLHLPTNANRTRDGLPHQKRTGIPESASLTGLVPDYSESVVPSDGRPSLVGFGRAGIL